MMTLSPIRSLIPICIGELILRQERACGNQSVRCRDRGRSCSYADAEGADHLLVVAGGAWRY